MRRARDQSVGFSMQMGPHPGEMHRRVDEFDWAATPLGPRETWSVNLELAVQLVLNNRFPMALRWGEDLVQIYNDAYADLLGDKHPRALGRPAREVWPEIEDRLVPLSLAILRGERDSFFAADHPWIIQRHGVSEEARFTVSYSPVPDPSSGSGIGGILVTALETTERVRNEKTLHLLTDQIETQVRERMRHITNEKLSAEQLRESERQFRLLVAGVTDYALYMIDPTGIVSSWNAGAERIKGYAAGEIIGQHFSRFYTEEDRANHMPERALAIAAKTGKFEAEAVRLRKDGSRFWANVVIDAIRDEQGQLLGFAKITRDITERREAQAALERAQQQLAQAQKMEALGQLTGGVAHDFNNLLMVVSGHAQALLGRLTDPKNLRSLEAIQAAASRGVALTRQLLTFSRRQAMNPKTVDLGQTVAAFRDVLASSARGNIHLQVDIPADVWPIAIDIPEFELALVNLVVNARDAMPEGGIITLSAANVALSGEETVEKLDGDFVALTVTDTGTGIPPEIIGKVFEPFFTTKSPDKGTGLGMSQAYGFARQSGGAIAIASELGRGTNVTIYMPRDGGVAAAITLPERSDPVPGHGETILVVEDNPEVKTVATAMLEQLDYRTIAVESAAAALNVLKSELPIDLVFTDVMLPGDLDGVALAQTIRTRYPRLPIVLTSGYAKALGAPHGLPILRKPYQLAALAQAIRDNLDGQRAAR